MIDVRDYDLALMNRIKSYFENTHWIMRPTIPLKEIRDRMILNGEDVTFPLITLRRTNCPILNKEYNSWSRVNSGISYNTSMDKNSKLNLSSIDQELFDSIVSSGHHDLATVVNSTFELTYYIDVLSLERDNFDTIMVEIQENLFRTPCLYLNNIKSDGSQDKLVKGQACHLVIDEVEDLSDLENFDSGNALYRATITVKLNAYIYRKYKSKSVESFGMTYIALNKELGNDGFTEP